MKPAKRRFFNGIAALSLTLFLASGIFSALQAGWGKAAYISIGYPKSFDIYSISGSFIFAVTDLPFMPKIQEEFRFLPVLMSNHDAETLWALSSYQTQSHQMGGFGVVISNLPPDQSGAPGQFIFDVNALILPQWFVTLALGVLPWIWIARWRKAKTMTANEEAL
jgi:hypothetical protein